MRKNCKMERGPRGPLSDLTYRAAMYHISRFNGDGYVFSTFISSRIVGCGCRLFTGNVRGTAKS